MPPDEKFGPSRRVRSRADFQRIQSRGRKLRTAHLLFAFLPAAEECRLGITVTKRVEKRAVLRNRLRRRLREIFRRSRSEFLQRVDLVIIALAGSPQLRYDQLREEFIELGRRAKLLVTDKPV